MGSRWATDAAWGAAATTWDAYIDRAADLPRLRFLRGDAGVASSANSGTTSSCRPRSVQIACRVTRLIATATHDRVRSAGY